MSSFASDSLSPSLSLPSCVALTTGESGLGKSTLINTLFNHRMYPKKEVPAPEEERPQTVAIESMSAGE